MPEDHNSDERRRRRRGRGPRRGPPNQGGQPPRDRQQQKQQEPSGLNKFLSLISFGLLGKSKSKPKPKPQPAPAPVRFEGGNSSNNGNRPPQSARPPRSDRGDREARPPREPRPPQAPTEVTSERLYVGNLSYDATESDLFELFNGVGKVQNAEVVVNSRTQRSKGFAFVTMATTEEAKRAVAELSNKDFMGRSLQISGAKPPQRDRDGREERGGSSNEDESESAEPSEESAAA